MKASEKKNNFDQARRRFLLKSLVTSVAAAFALSFKSSAKEALMKEDEKIKLLTPDGKLVEISKSKIKKEASNKPSNKEVRDWMNNKSDNS